MPTIQVPTHGNPYRSTPGVRGITLTGPASSASSMLSSASALLHARARAPGVAQGDLHGFQSGPSTGTADQQDAFAFLSDTLDQYGLGSLAQWAWNELLNGRTPNEILIDMRQTPEFNKRFPAIKLREQAGLPPISPGEYVSYENQATQMMRAAGLPPGFYDQPDDFTNLIANDVSATELNQRITQGFDAVSQADPNVRAAFANFFGPSGDAALASLFLDPDQALPVLENQVAAATFAGTGMTFGFNVNKDLAMRAAESNLPSYTVRADWQKLGELTPLFDNTVGEQQAGSNLTQDQGIEGTFGIGDNAQAARAAMLRRQQQRLEEFAGGGGAMVTGHGVRGLGSAEGNV